MLKTVSIGMVVWASVAWAQESPAVEARTAYLTGNSFRIADIAKAALEKNPDAGDLRVWTALAGRPGAAVSAANQLRAKDANSAWALLAAALVRDADTTALVKKALDAAKGNPEVLELATHVLTRKARDTRKTADLSAFLEARSAEFAANAGALLAEVEAWKMLDQSAASTAHQALIDDLLEQVLKLEPANVAAIWGKANRMRSKNASGAYEFLKSACTRLPRSYEIHLLFWETGSLVPKTQAGEIEREVIADAKKLVAASKPEPAFVNILYNTLDSTLADAVDQVAGEVERLYPDSALADSVTYRRAVKDPPMTDPETAAELKTAALGEFVKRPKHYSDAALENAYSQLAYLLSNQKEPDLELLFRAASALETSTMDLSLVAAIVKLADAKVHLPELERIALKVSDGYWQVMFDSNKDFLDPGWADFVATNRVNLMQDALGWVYFQEGRPEEALDKLNASLKLVRAPDLLVHRGRVYQSRKQFDLAEKDYLAALEMPWRKDGANPAVPGLRSLYVARHGSEEGVDAYMAPIFVKERDQRRTQVLAERLRAPKDMPAFRLLSLDGKPVTSDSFKGRILVVNFWATWCGPCRHEMPDLEKFYQQHKDDPAVAFLTISTDDSDTPDAKVQAVIEGGKFTFPVVRGADFAKENRIEAIPVTWFVDAGGKLAFHKLGGSPSLVEEFGWRIDALKQPAGK